MSLFLSDEELRLLSDDAAAVAERADGAIRDLRCQLDTVRAEADAAAIAAEQNCALLEQRYETLSSDLARVRSENTQLSASLEQRLSEIADAQAEKHQLHLKAIGKDGEIERLSLEVAELNKSKRHLLELLEQKDAETREKNATIQSYLDKIINLTDNAVDKEARLQNQEAELARCRATCVRVNQEKELLEKHNAWLNEELSAKVNSLVEERKTHMEIVADMSAKLADFERQINETSSSLKRNNERIQELEMRNASLEKELCSSKDAAAANEEQLSSELSTVTKLAELYKERSEEWSKKAGELEGVIKALETHLSQVENEYKNKLENESSLRKNLEKDASDMKGKLEKYEAELESARKANELSIIPMSRFHADTNLEELSVAETTSCRTYENNQMLVPKFPIGISGTALAASLIRDGWSLAKIYEKYQEAADAARHEKWGRKNAEAVLERVLHEIEEKAEIILDERAEHERMIEAYNLMNQKLQQSLLEHDSFENIIRNLKAELKKRERDYTIAQKEISDLEKQVTVLLKECQDIQVRCGVSQVYADNSLASSLDIDGINAGGSTTECPMSFKDINELVEQNVHLRSHVLRLSSEIENKEEELKENFQIQLQKVTEEATAKVDTVLKKSEEQGQMIESLHSSVAMYRRLYEEERRTLASSHVYKESIPEDGKKELMLLFEGSQEVSRKAYEQLAERARSLEEDLGKLRSEVSSLRLERDKRALEANFAKDHFDGLKKEIEHQRKEANAVSARNVELTHLVVDFQKRLRECSNSLQEAEENARKLTMEVSILKHEKEILNNSERRASDEVRNLSERVHRLQSSLDTIQSAGEVRENSRAVEMRKLEEYAKQIEREWAEVKRELQEERDRVRALTNEKENALEASINQFQEMKKELAEAWSAVASAESRAAVAEARCSEFETKMKSTEHKVIKGDSRHDHTVFSTNEVSGELWKITEELEKIKEEAKANKDYMVQYKEIAHTNDVALKQIESAHETYKLEAERVKKALEGEVSSLRDRVSELEKQYVLKCEEAVSLTEAKDREVSSLLAETSGLRGEISQKVTQIESLGTQLSLLKEDLEREHKRWRTAQDNYERQVMLQSETIQELTKTSKELSLLQCEIAKLQEVSDTIKTENEMLKTSWEKEKVTLQAMKDEAERKSNELNEQNKILLGQLESLHVRLADKEHNSAGLFAQSTDSKAESDLHSVISHLRRSKEIAETEKTLLKQENSRLQAQLETALKASEAAQKLLHSKCENDRAMLFKDEEFKALQLQVREINLLRESNMQLREENKHNFDECQKYRDEAQKAKVDAEKYENLLMEKQLEFDACQKEVEMLRIEINHLNNRINELAESHKNIDPEEYDRMKNELQQTKGTIKQENEKQKKLLSILKKKNDTLAKEKEDLNQEKEVLLKEIEDFKSGRKTSGDTSTDQATKEKDTRIQILEKTLERERDDNKKEKQKRQSTEKTMLELIQKVNKDKKSFLEEFSRHKHAVEMLKATGVTAQLPSESTLDEQFATYLQTTTQLEAASGSIADDGLGSHSVAVDTSATDTSMPVAGSGRQVSAQQIRQLTSQVKSAEEKERGSTVVKVATGARKVGRRLVRPRLERPEEPQVDVGTSGMDGPTQMEEEKAGSSHEPEPAGDNSLTQSTSSSRKRLASSTAEQKEDIVARDEVGADTAPPPKKPKESDVMQDVMQDSNDEQIILPATENIETTEASFPSSNVSDVQTPEDMEADQAPVLPNEETADAVEDDDTFVKEEPVEEQKASFDDTNREEEVQGEGDAIVEELSDKPTETIELLDESLRSEGGKEILQLAAADEDEKEEGELIADEAEEQEEGGKSGDCQRESTPSDGAGIGDETGYAVEASSPEVPSQKNASADAMDEVREGHNNEDQFVHESSQSPQRSLGVREGSLSTTGHATISQQQSSSTISETEESRAGRTITISERAKQNARLRQAGIAAPATSRGRGRTTGGFRGNRGAGRGGRARGGRGQPFGERE
ncbi:nuclear-pore anchor isoform X2 [Musa acuminata AAA Group]|uniref:nuclear-pore anchor isoform X2 n=1 Tax=Musa acuminata AAA Group TaxID=214697 RepID=UPI0031D0C69F